jgi:hypothetical protein
MTDELPKPPAAPEAHALKVRESAALAFAQAAAEAKAPGGRARSIWRRRIEPWLVAIAAVGFVAWALARVFLSR